MIMNGLTEESNMVFYNAIYFCMVASMDVYYKSLHNSSESIQQIQFIAIKMLLHISRNCSVKEPKNDFEQACQKVWHSRDTLS